MPPAGKPRRAAEPGHSLALDRPLIPVAEARTTYVDNRDTAFHLAILYSLAGDRDAALDLLRTSADRRETAFPQATNPATFRAIRNIAAFKAVLGRLKALDGA